MRISLAAAACSALALAAPSVGRTPAPALRLVSTQPLTVRGVHFFARERVRVTKHMGSDTWSKLVRATPTGTFKVTFAAPMAIDPCLENARVTAVGARGSRAAVRVPQQACPSP